MATIGKRINGENDKPERYALIYVEGEQDLNINITGEVTLGNSPFSSQAATKNKKSYSGIYAPDSNITITGDRSLLILTHEVALYAKKLTIAMTAQGQRSVDCENYGACVIVKHDLVAKDNSKLCAYTNNAWADMRGIAVGNNLTVEGANAEVKGTATLQDKSQKSYTPCILYTFFSSFISGIGVKNSIYVDKGKIYGKCNKKVGNKNIYTSGVETKKLLYQTAQLLTASSTTLISEKAVKADWLSAVQKVPTVYSLREKVQAAALTMLIERWSL